MERFSLKIGELSAIVCAVVLGCLMIGVVFLFGTDWTYLNTDVTDGVIPVESVRIVDELPLSEATQADLLAGKDLGDLGIEKEVHPGGVWKLKRATFSDTLQEVFADRAAGRDLLGAKFAVYFDLPREVLKLTPSPFLYMAGIWSDVDIYVDGHLLGTYPSRTANPAIPIPRGETPSVRVSMIFTNNWPHKLAAFNALRGVSVRTSEALGRSTKRMVLQLHVPNLITGTAFVIFGALAVMFAVSGRGYIDIWAFAAFCFCFGLQVWSKTPMVYEKEEFTFVDDYLGNIILQGAFVLAATVMSLSFFRFEGRDMRVKDLGTMTFWRSFSFFKLSLRASIICLFAIGAYYLVYRGEYAVSNRSSEAFIHFMSISQVWIVLAGMGLDVHVLATTLRETKITVKGGIDKPAASPDFYDPRFTRLSALFKPSKWNRIAVYTDDAALLANGAGRFVQESGGMGFWTFDAPSDQRERRAS